MVLRPDEEANLSELERNQKLKKNISMGVGLAGTVLATRVAPFLSENIPIDLAMKGINKLSPSLGNFLKRGQDMGLNLREGFEYLKNNLFRQNEQETHQETSPPPPPKEDRNIVEKYSPELHSFMMQEIKAGRSPLQAGAIAQLPGKVKDADKIIKKMMKDYGMSWSNIVESVYGSSQQSQPQQTQQQAPSQPQSPQQATSAQPGSGQQALMSILEKINQKLGS